MNGEPVHIDVLAGEYLVTVVASGLCLRDIAVELAMRAGILPAPKFGSHGELSVTAEQVYGACRNGHKLTASSSFVRVSKQGRYYRQCRRCDQERRGWPPNRLRQHTRRGPAYALIVWSPSMTMLQPLYFTTQNRPKPPRRRIGITTS